MKQLAIGLAIVIALSAVGLHILEDPVPTTPGRSGFESEATKKRSSMSGMFKQWLKDRRSELIRYRRGAKAKWGPRDSAGSAAPSRR